MGKIQSNNFRERLFVTSGILKRIAFLYKYCEYLFKDESNNRHVLNLRVICLDRLVLELAKLFIDNKNEKHNLFSFLNDLKSQSENYGMKESDISNWIKKLLEFESTFQSIKEIRDKFVAHTDSYGSHEPTSYFFPRIKSLIDKSFEILNSCSQSIVQEPVSNTLDSIKLDDLKFC